MLVKIKSSVAAVHAAPSTVNSDNFPPYIISYTMFLINDSEYENNSYTFFGPVGMAFYDDGNVLDDTYAVKVALSVCLGVTMVLGIVGNVFTCAMIIQNRAMRTPTNYYLLNLAITDLLLVLFVPIEIYIIWVPDFYPLGEVGCHLHFLLWDILSYCSLLIITAFTVERYIVVTRPFLRQKLSLNSRVFKIVGVIWAVSIILNLPDIFNIDLLERKKYVFCYFSVSDIISILLIIEIIVIFIIPMTIIFSLYILITYQLKCTHRKLRSSPASGQHNKDKALKFIAAVAILFLISWSPYCALRVMLILPKFEYENDYNVWKVLNYLCYIAHLSSAVNPILYGLMSKKFRQAFKAFVRRPKCYNWKRTNLTQRSITRNNSKNDIILREVKLNNT